jgi:hypothetical protein
MKYMSYAFAAMAGLCFMSGLFILSSEGDNDYGATRNTTGIIR